jgi:4-aminobutyrate aminotransferase-like enzyme
VHTGSGRVEIDGNLARWNQREEIIMLTKTFTRLNVPGPKARDLLARDHKVVSHAYGRVADFVMDHGRGTEVWDVDGNRYLDFM